MTFAFSSVFILLLCTRTPRSPLQQDIPKYECPASDNDNTSFSLSLIQSENEGTSPRCSPSLFSSPPVTIDQVPSASAWYSSQSVKYERAVAGSYALQRDVLWLHRSI